jgi:hypothetical protein
MERMTVKLSTEERQALQNLAKFEVRDFRDQARYIIRKELESLGLLKVKQNEQHAQDGRLTN